MQPPSREPGHETFLKTFGTPSLVNPSASASLRKKDLALLIYLRIEAGRSHSRGFLANLLWGDTTEEKARHSLSQALGRVRTLVGGAGLIADGENIVGGGELRCDAILLQEMAAGVIPIDPTLKLYTGDFLAYFTAGAGVRDFDDWADGKRGRFRALALDLLDQLGSAAEQEGNWNGSLVLGERATEIDPLWENGHRRVMRAWNALGERNRALRHYEKLVSRLRTEMEDEPDPETQALAEHFRRISPHPATTSRHTSATPAAGAVEPTPAPACDESDDPGSTTSILTRERPSAADPRSASGRVRHRRSFVLTAAAVALVAVVWASRSELRENVGSTTAAESNRINPQGYASCPSGRSLARLVDEKFPDGSPIPPGERFRKTWTLRNAGTCTWDSAHRFYYMGGKLSLTQTHVRIEGAVPPAGVYTFAVPMQAPNTPGTYRDEWTLRDAGGRTVPVGGSKIIWAEIVVPEKGATVCNADDAVAKFLGENYLDGTEVSPGESFTKTWTIRNSGSCAWNSTLALQYVSDDNGRLSVSQADVPIHDTVPPGATYTFAVPMRAPRAPGLYREDWRLRDAEGNGIRISGSTTIWAEIAVQSR